jgi:phage terminase large subunit
MTDPLAGLLLPSRAQLLAAAQEILARRRVEHGAPAVLWQAPGEPDTAFSARVAVAGKNLDRRVWLLAVRGPCTAAAPPGVRWVELPPKLLALLNPTRRTRYRVAYGGRGSGKSWAFARALIVRALAQPLRVLCGRELQGSITESVHRLLSDQIAALGVAPWFEVQQTSITGRNGSEFIFSGIRNNVSKVKSTEGIDICWIEEAEKISEYSWSVIVPTVRSPGSEIWASFNPDQSDDPTFERFVTNPQPGALIDHVSHSDNPWFPPELEAERIYLQRVDPDAHAWIWGGQCRAESDAQIFRGKYTVEAFEPPPPDAPQPWSGPYFGADWGFSQDPTTLVKCWVGGRALYIEHEAYSVGCDIDKTPALFDQVPGARRHAIRADSARPETISYMCQHGYPRVEGAMKWPGSIQDGIAFIRQFERVVIHPRCVHTIEEARLYSYKVDKLSGDVLPDVVDKHNHIWDAVRYALSPLIKTPPGWGFLQFLADEKERAG